MSVHTNPNTGGPALQARISHILRNPRDLQPAPPPTAAQWRVILADYSRRGVA